jgi:GxxExxY protein
MSENKIGTLVFDAAFKVHSALGLGLLESSYQVCTFYELQKIGLKVENEKALPLYYEEVKMDSGYRIDLLVEDKVVIEIKAVELLADAHLAQVLTYLKLSQCKLGYLLNFNVPLMKSGIKRVVNGV